MAVTISVIALATLYRISAITTFGTRACETEMTAAPTLLYGVRQP